MAAESHDATQHLEEGMNIFAFIAILIIALGSWTHLEPIHLGAGIIPIRLLLYGVFFGIFCTMAWRLLCGEWRMKN